MFRNIVLFPNRFGQKLLGVDHTPDLLRTFLSDHNKYYPVYCNKRIENNLNNLYFKMNKINERKMIIGGDHSMSIATVSDTLNRSPNAKVIWIDAHADINTPKSSLSKNIHGMPLGFLTGLVSDNDLVNYKFIKNKLPFENIMYIGLRDIDPYEKDILQSKKISVITAHDLENNNYKVKSKIDNFILDSDIHLSFDVDSLDPTIMPCTGTPSDKGIKIDTAIELMNMFDRKRIINMDVTELNLSIGTKHDKMTSLYNIFKILYRYVN